MFSAEFEIINKNNDKVNDRPLQLREALRRSVVAMPSDALLLSGGIDSAMLAALDPRIPAITVVLKNQGQDLQNAQRVVNHLGMEWYPIEIDTREALKDLQELTILTNSYDPGLLNDIPIYQGLKYAARLGFRNVRTGDAADTLFGGYTYLGKEEDFNLYLRRLIPQIRLASSAIGRQMNIKMSYPYLHPEVLSLALQMSPSENEVYIESEQHGDFVESLYASEVRGFRRWGKIVLRKAARGLLPNAIAWRTKTDLEFGSGMYILEKYLESQIGEQELVKLKNSGKHFWNLMHGALYLLYKDTGSTPPEAQEGEYDCSWCDSGVIEGRRHCSTCGAYPSNQKKMFTFENETI